MSDLNLKGLNVETITNIALLLLALVNMILQLFGVNILPISNEDIVNIVSSLFLVGEIIWNTWKNRNITTASQKAQEITDAIKAGELIADDIDAMLRKIKAERLK